VKSSFDRKSIGGFALALALLLGIEALLYHSTAKQAETTRLVARTHEVLSGIQELILRLTDAETARRGFIMTGQDRYLTHYSNAVERVSRAFSHLRDLTKDDLRQQQACAALDPLIRDRFEVYSQSIRGQLSGADRDTQLRLTEKGQNIMEEIRTQIGRMETGERGLRRTRQAAAEANFKQTRRFALVSSAASVTMLVLVFVLLIRENARRQRAEADLQKINEELETRVRQRTAELTQALAGHERAEQEIKKLNEGLEQRVAERTAQLEAANQELEAFSYSVSHDLRAPLRHVGGFVEMLRQEAANDLSAKGRQYVGVISDSANQMGRLIDNLLSFSRMGRTEMRKIRINMEELLQEVVQETRRDTEGRAIEWNIGPLPTVMGDRSMLKQVWVNLVSNAVKFTRGRQPARIEIHCQKGQNQEWQFCICDNGAGFDMKYAEKLFGVFQRLHRADEFEGTGIGLANVRRIVHRHGGRTWAEGIVNQGAAFYIALPDSMTD